MSWQDLIQPSLNCRSMFEDSQSKEDELLLDMASTAFLITIICFLYIPVMVMIWLNRNKQAVYFKSP